MNIRDDISKGLEITNDDKDQRCDNSILRKLIDSSIACMDVRLLHVMPFGAEQDLTL